MRNTPLYAYALTVNLFGRFWECRHLVTADQLSEANTLRWQELVHRESDRDLILETRSTQSRVVISRLPDLRSYSRFGLCAFPSCQRRQRTGPRTRQA